MGLRTTTAGWFPKPAALRKARWQHAEGEIDDAKLRDAEDLATRDALAWQAELGLDVLTDGQLERSDLVGYWAERLDGVDEGLLVRVWGNRYYRRPRVEDAIARDEPIAAPRFTAAAAMTDAPLKAVVTGPYTLMDWSFDEHYGSREACARAFAEVIRAEVGDLVAAGAKQIQLDEPAISVRPSEMPLVRELLQQVTAPAAGQASITLRLCFGDLAPVLPEVLGLPVDALYLELANSRFAALDGLGDLPAERQLVAGVVDVTVDEVETTDELKKRIERLLSHVRADRLTVAPDAGLHGLTGKAARAKLQHLVTAAASF